ncbi:BQ2448_5241 [Microbotryum intermedium]|uniref:BQ2448_5241 protein n=1 Tax=Microbotryum intermedium TaxID=269621 RepID=A0A238F0H1_9BASI|nr:BQ2448_5241 [Microbotryum intermedium]
MVVVPSTAVTQRLLVRSLTTSTRILNQAAGVSPSSSSSSAPSPPSLPSDSSSVHERQSRQRRPQSILHVADAGGATMTATMRAIELTKARRETTPSSSPQRGRGGGAPRQFTATGGEGALGSLLTRRRRAHGVVYDQDAQEIGAITSLAPKPAARDSNGGGVSRFAGAVGRTSQGRFERERDASARLPSGDASFSSAFPRERREGRPPSSSLSSSSSSSSGARPSRAGPPTSQARGGPQRPPRRPTTSSRSSLPRDKKSQDEEARPLAPLVTPKFVEVPTLDLSSLPPSSPVLTTKASTAAQSTKGYAAYLPSMEAQISSESKLGDRQRGVLMHAQGLLSRNPSVGLKQRRVVLEKVEEALRR